MDKKFLFWQKWLFYSNIMFVIMGVLVAFAGNSFLFDLHNTATEKVYFESAPISGDLLRFKNWMFAVIGGTIVGFHLLMVFIAKYPFKNKERWAWNSMALATLGWFVIDSGLSIYNGAIHNVYLINLVALVFIGIPLAMTWRTFYKEIDSNKR